MLAVHYKKFSIIKESIFYYNLGHERILFGSQRIPLDPPSRLPRPRRVVVWLREDVCGELPDDTVAEADVTQQETGAVRRPPEVVDLFCHRHYLSHAFL